MDLDRNQKRLSPPFGVPVEDSPPVLTDKRMEMSGPRLGAPRFDRSADLWLTRLWPLAILLHLAGNGRHLAMLDLVGVLQLVMVGLAAAQIVRPRSAEAGGLALLYLSVLWLKLPVVGNHEIILGLFSMAVLGAVVQARDRWTTAVAPVGRWILLLSYGFIAVSKLNSGFFDAAGSCAVVFADELVGITGFQPSGSSFVGAAVIVGTAAVELAIPLLLVTRRFRSRGVGLALLFHFILALDPASHIWDFSATLLPLFLLFAPVELRVDLDRRLADLARRPSSERALVVGLLICCHGLLAFGRSGFGPWWLVAYPVWLVVGGGLLLVSWRHLLPRSHPATSEPGSRAPGVADRSVLDPGVLDPGVFDPGVLEAVADRTGVPEPEAGRPGDHGGPARVRSRLLLAWFGAVVVLTAANGVAPYLELRSAAAFNMYSNLRIVDGQSNHLFIPPLRAVPDSDERPDFVTLDDVGPDSPLIFYSDRGLAVPTQNLDRYLAVRSDENPIIGYGPQSVPARSVGLGQAHTDRGFWASTTDVFARNLGFRRAVTADGQPGCLRAWGPIG